MNSWSLFGWEKVYHNLLFPDEILCFAHPPAKSFHILSNIPEAVEVPLLTAIFHNLLILGPNNPKLWCRWYTDEYFGIEHRMIRYRFSNTFDEHGWSQISGPAIGVRLVYWRLFLVLCCANSTSCTGDLNWASKFPFPTTTATTTTNTTTTNGRIFILPNLPQPISRTSFLHSTNSLSSSLQCSFSLRSED